MKKLIVLLTFAILSIFSSAQENQFRFNNISKNQGLSNNHVQAFLRDKKGFLWIGTMDGLCRFDGYDFKIFKNIPGDTSSLSDNIITNLFEDNTGKIWITTGNHLDIFDPATEIFSHKQSLFNNRIPVPAQSRWFAEYDPSGNILFVNDKSGLYKYLVVSDSVIEANFHKNDPKYNITCMGQDRLNKLWLACKNGYLYQLNKNDFSVIDSISLPSHKNVEVKYRFIVDNDNNLWVYDKNNGLGVIFINTLTKKSEIYSSNSPKCRLNNNAVMGIVQDNQGQIWISTDHGGINLINPINKTVNYIVSDPLNASSLCDNATIAIYKDQQNFIWIGTVKKGLSYYHNQVFKFNQYKVPLPKNATEGYNDINNFSEDHEGNLWLGTNGGGLVYFNRKNNTYKSYLHEPADPTSIGSNIVVGMLKDSKNRLWIGTYFGGLNLYENGKFRQFKNLPNDKTSITDNRIWDICEDHYGNIWLAELLGGVNVFDPKSFTVKQTLTWDSDSSIRSKVVFSIMEDKDYNIWFSTVDGLREYNPVNNKFKYYFHNDSDTNSLSSNIVFSAYEDSRGLIWAATSNGLNMFDKSTRKFKIFKQREGLPSNSVYTIKEDKNHNLWLGTSMGLSNLIISEKNTVENYQFEFKNYDVNDGLQGNDFNEKAAFVTQNNELVFGGPNGFNIFNPDKINLQNTNAEIVITDFQVSNKSISTREWVNNKQILNKSIAYTNEIEISYKENIFTLEFSSLNFLHSERRLYKYQLENFNTDWLYTDANNRKATFTNLNPGKYTFRIKATDNAGNWTDEASLVIIVKPPWWNTIFFKLAAFFIVTGIIGFSFLNRMQNLKMHKLILESRVKERTHELSKVNSILEDRQEEITLQNEELGKHRNQLEQLVKERTHELEIAKEKAEESDKLKSAFLANMSHEIRTPMNSIVGFSSMLADYDLSVKERNNFIKIINDNCEMLLVLINDILDLSKIEAHQFAIHKTNFDADKILEELEGLYQLHKEKKELDIIFSNKGSNTRLILNTDIIRFRQVITNLLENAIKYTEKGMVEFGYQIKNNEVEFFVIDSGIGIKSSDHGKLFMHFQKIEHTGEKLYRGTGLGLSISKKLVEIMGGRIWLSSVYGKGSTFYFTLPLGKTVEIPEVTEVNNEFLPQQLLNNFTILVAEDEEANFELIKNALRTYPLIIEWAKNGIQAVDYVKKLDKYDHLLILMDIKMPIMNGVEALKEIRKLSNRIPVIAVTAYAYETEKLDILKNDFNDFISKPLRPSVLIATIEKAIRNNS